MFRCTLLNMASNETDVSDREADDYANNCENNSEKVFKCCSKSCKVCICNRCFAIFHESCIKRMKNVKIINERMIECCDKKSEDESDKDEYKSLKVEIHYLKLLVEEMRDKNNVLTLSNKLLQEKLGEVSKDQIDNNCAVIPTIKITDDNKRKQTDQSYADRVGTRESSSSEPRKESQTTQRKQIYCKQVSIQEQQIRLQTQPIKAIKTSKIEMAKNEKSNEENHEREYQWQYQRRRPNRKRMGTIGTSNETTNDDFAGVQKKLWIYIYRVNKACSEEKVHGYIKQKTGLTDNEVWTKEIPVKGNGLNRYVVTAPIDKKDLLYSSEFWPNGVGVKRFDFDKHREFLQTLNIQKEPSF